MKYNFCCFILVAKYNKKKKIPVNSVSECMLQETLIYFYSKTNQMHNIANLFYFCNNSLRVSDGLSVHHQESKTVHTASDICHTGSVAAC